ncbi:potassium channel family protein [Pelagimonas varians]|uniref:Voltage-gated potassium channel n=1 Tax=Pelagimonas varians TaxID=696760 RepID=A0A238K6N9_9RHOB|nr:potassium channel family protein [Pelagimonas varians]PYG31882.1 voltage-gated potassium channel [Pelagimonas varians]SMX38475.1 voltage-gated potassium channel [Pelagimonas varians]
MNGYKVMTLVAMMIAVISIGTVFFHVVEEWSWLDSYFFTVVTLSTVGYGELVPATAIGKIGTTVFIITGLGIFAAAIQQFGHYAIRRREHHTETLHATLGREEPQTANQDRAPDNQEPDYRS